ncbi:MAG TPA: sigma-70 family RNA polymerase sigma factor [Mycobacteriales bacterium]|nr:sigma-70 family RNA polymerase sigma factor [Mycobacteriales bacterium]
MDVDAAMVRACQRGEPGALDALIRATYAQVYRLCQRMLADPEEAADATQEVFIRVTRSVLGFRGESAFGTWLHRVTVNVCLTALHRRTRARSTGVVAGRQPFAVPGDLTAERLAAQNPNPADQAIRAELARRAERAVATLPEDARTVVVLRDLEGLSTKEVADLLGVSESVVKVRLCRAHARLRRDLADGPPGRLAGDA